MRTRGWIDGHDFLIMHALDAFHAKEEVKTVISYLSQ
jgi:hypothetical protein